MKKSDKIIIVVLIFFVSFMLLFGSHVHNKRNEMINNNMGLTTGMLIREYQGMNGNFYVEYTYSVDDKIYINDFNSGSVVKLCDTGNCFEQKYIVEYCIIKPEVSRIIIMENAKYPDGNSRLK